MHIKRLCTWTDLIVAHEFIPKIAMHYILIAEKGTQSTVHRMKTAQKSGHEEMRWFLLSNNWIYFLFCFTLFRIRWVWARAWAVQCGNAAMNVEAQEMRLIVFKLKYRTTSVHTKCSLFSHSQRLWNDWITVKMINELMAY